MNRSGALYKHDITPGGNGSLTTIRPNSSNSHGLPSSFKIRTEINKMVKIYNNIFDIFLHQN